MKEELSLKKRALEAAWQEIANFKARKREAMQKAVETYKASDEHCQEKLAF